MSKMEEMEEIKWAYVKSLEERLADANKQIADSNKQIKDLKHKSVRDELTGLYSRNYYETNINSIVQDAITKKQKVGLYIFDLNGLKYVNDNFGHSKGDKILKDFSSLLSSSVRAYDKVIRIGGDEFMVIARKATPLTEQKIRERLENKLKLYNEHSNKDINYDLSFAAGYALINHLKKNPVKSAFDIADKNMYEEKKDYHAKLINSNINK